MMSFSVTFYKVMPLHQSIKNKWEGRKRNTFNVAMFTTRHYMEAFQNFSIQFYAKTKSFELITI